MKHKTIIEAFFKSRDLSLNPLFEDIQSDPVTDQSTPGTPQESIQVSRSGLPLSDIEEAESTLYGESFIRLLDPQNNTDDQMIAQYPASLYGQVFDTVPGDVYRYLMDPDDVLAELSGYAFFMDSPRNAYNEVLKPLIPHIENALNSLPNVDPIFEAGLRYCFVAAKYLTIKVVAPIYIGEYFFRKMEYQIKKEYGLKALRSFEENPTSGEMALEDFNKTYLNVMNPYLNHLQQIKQMLSPYVKQTFGNVKIPSEQEIDSIFNKEIISRRKY